MPTRTARRASAAARNLAAALALLALVASAACDRAAGGLPAPAPAPMLTPAPGVLASRGCGDLQTVDPAASVETLHGSDGSCVPPSQAVVARCAASEDPVAFLDLSGVPRRFLGGAFAVPVAGVPTGAVALGTTTLGRFWVVPSDPRSLTVEAGGRFERWLRLPAVRTLSRPPTVHMVGDSILDGDATAMTAALPDWSVTTDAVIGRGSYDAAAAVDAMPLPLPDVVVIEIGVNDHDASVFSANQLRMLSKVADAGLVVWVTAHGPDPAITGIDRAIFANMGTLPNGAVADWDRSVPPDALSSDGIHPDAGNEGLLAALVAPMLITWREAVLGRGPTSCAAAVTAAVVG